MRTYYNMFSSKSIVFLAGVAFFNRFCYYSENSKGI